MLPDNAGCPQKSKSIFPVLPCRFLAAMAVNICVSHGLCNSLGCAVCRGGDSEADGKQLKPWTTLLLNFPLARGFVFAQKIITTGRAGGLH